MAIRDLSHRHRRVLQRPCAVDRRCERAEHPNLCAGGNWSATHVRILIYSANFAPEQVGIGKYSGEMACWLAQRGHTLRIVAAPPYYPEWKLNSAYRRRRYRRE